MDLREYDLLGPALPQVGSTLSSTPWHYRGAELYRLPLCVRLVGTGANKQYLNCAFFCSCMEDQKGGNVVFGKYWTKDQKQ